MKVSSPIGDLPFKPTRLYIKDGAIHMVGSMGAWPAHIQINMSDILNIVYLLRYMILALFAGIIGVIAILLMMR